jgi:hypothetical protein
VELGAPWNKRLWKAPGAGAAILLILVALLGMIPAATATGIGPTQRPLATVIVGGLCPL